MALVEGIIARKVKEGNPVIEAVSVFHLEFNDNCSKPAF
jgi:hypothetical protein